MNSILRYGCLAAISLLFFSLGAQAETLGDFAGVKACIKCHENIVKGWQLTPHGRAFEDLKEQGEEKQSIPGCVKCHVVGFDEDGGFVDMNLTPELKDVQCECCHGPGQKHVKSEGDTAFIIGAPGESSCRVCHTEGQDKNFDFVKKSRWVHIPEKTIEKQSKSIPSQGEVFTISETSVAFGNMVEGEEVRKTVLLTNTGTKDVTITNVSTSCACTTTRLGQSKLKPKESTELEITYHTYKFPGKFLKYVTVFTDIPAKSEYVVNISGFVKAIPMGVLEVKPRKIALIGNLKTNSPFPFNIAITNTGDADMEVSKIVSKKRGTVFFDAAKRGKLIIKPGKTVHIETSIISEEKGRMIDYIMIHSNARNVTSKGYKVVLIGTFE